ncbi:hypothetical protein M8J77_025928 [Diaphorina citri]|nr:hypothetical protein M8J77_025928 [Diaphorina citri]
MPILTLRFKGKQSYKKSGQAYTSLRIRQRALETGLPSFGDWTPIIWRLDSHHLETGYTSFEDWTPVIWRLDTHHLETGFTSFGDWIIHFIWSVHSNIRCEHWDLCDHNVTRSKQST